ncbi:MAG: hypothetical protein HC779_08500 [Phyllobacteriaceae bacterium]|nr:hypothetical protein [Phyllobacteriaceae bacterium]
MRAIAITDADDPRIAPYRNLKDRDLLHRGGYFIGEGKFILERMLSRSAFAPISILIRDDKLAALEGILASLPQTVPLYVAEAPVMNAIAGFDIHRGILALGSAVPEAPGTPKRCWPIAAALAYCAAFPTPKTLARFSAMPPGSAWMPLCLTRNAATH